jgi:hypothetical protein
MKPVTSIWLNNYARNSSNLSSNLGVSHSNDSSFIFCFFILSASSFLTVITDDK